MPRDDPARPVLVPDPDVLHLDLEQRVGGLDPRLQLDLVAEVGRVRREHAVAEQREDRRVLLLQLELEIGLELVELVEVRHHADCSPATRSASGPRPGTTRSRVELGQRLEREQALVQARMRAPPAPARRSVRRRTGAGRGRSSAARSAGLRGSGRAGARSRAAGRAARGPAATSRPRRRRSGTGAGRPLRPESVSRKAETPTTSTPGSAASCSSADRTIASRSPRLAPSPTYARVIGCGRRSPRTRRPRSPPGAAS